MKKSKIIGVIPARYASTRLPGKPLTIIAGKTLIARVIEGALKSQMLDVVIVATDHQDIFKEAENAGAKPLMTAENLPSGSDRVYDAILKLDEKPDYIINIQGDEVFITGEIIDSLADFITSNEYDVATLIKRINNSDGLFNENVVKVVLGAGSKAHYFSRATIPYIRDVNQINWLDKHTFYKHIGIYAYKFEALENFVNLPTSINENVEKLEQLRFIDNGIDIYCKEICDELLGVDTPEDARKAENIIKSNLK